MKLNSLPKAGLGACLALGLSGCAHKAELAPLERSVPTEQCERILTPVPRPNLGKDPDARVAFLKEANARKTANGRIDAGRDCVSAVRKSYKEK